VGVWVFYWWSCNSPVCYRLPTTYYSPGVTGCSRGLVGSSGGVDSGPAPTGEMVGADWSVGAPLGVYVTD
jgi:hypothetical protein